MILPQPSRPSERQKDPTAARIHQQPMGERRRRLETDPSWGQSGWLVSLQFYNFVFADRSNDLRGHSCGFCRSFLPISAIPFSTLHSIHHRIPCSSNNNTQIKTSDFTLLSNVVMCHATSFNFSHFTSLHCQALSNASSRRPTLTACIDPSAASVYYLSSLSLFLMTHQNLPPTSSFITTLTHRCRPH
jgi:hypothetical protein